MSIVAGMAEQMTYGLGRAVKGKDERARRNHVSYTTKSVSWEVISQRSF